MVHLNRIGYLIVLPEPQFAGFYDLDDESVEADTGLPTQNLTLDLCSDCSPIVDKPFTRIFQDSVGLRNLGSDGLPCVLQFYSHYPIWPGAACLALAATKTSELKVISASEADISKDYYIRPERKVHQTLRTLRTLPVSVDGTLPATLDVTLA